MKIRTKLILANLFVVLFLLGSLTYMLTRWSSKLVYEHIVQNASLSLSQISQNLDNRLESYEDIANTLFLNSSLNFILDQQYGDQLEAYEVYSQQFKPYLASLQATRDLYHINVYTDNPTFFFANVLPIDDQVRSSAWYKEIMRNKTGGLWTAPYVNFMESDPVISFRKRLNNMNPNSASVVSLEIKLQNIVELVSQESKNKRVIFTLADGTVIMDSGSEKIARLQDLLFAGKIMSGQEGSFRAKSGGDSYQIVFQTLNSRNIVRGMKVVAFVPTTELTPQINRLRSLAFGLFGLAFAISALLFGVIAVRMTRRLVELSQKLRRVHRDNFQTFVEVKGRDEVAQLGEMFNLMVRRVGQLIQEVYQAEIDRKEQALRTKEVELYALQAQVNPHFLFNVLNTIRGKLLIVGERDTAKVVGLLAKSFRMMLKSGGPTVSLAEELEFVDSYLQIQQYRFGHKFRYAIEVPEEFRRVPIPKLCVQPFAENAVQHGIELNPEPSSILIAGERSGEDLLLRVADDGMGMPPERLAEIKGWLEREGEALQEDAHIGLRNVHARLKFIYGADYGIRIESESGRGTAVTIRIPLSGGTEGEERHVRSAHRG